MNRRQFLLSTAVLGLSASTYAGIKFWPEQGLTNPRLSGMPDKLKNDPLMRQIWAGLDPAQVWDSHVHLVGTGDSERNI